MNDRHQMKINKLVASMLLCCLPFLFIVTDSFIVQCSASPHQKFDLPTPQQISTVPGEKVLNCFLLYIRQTQRLVKQLVGSFTWFSRACQGEHHLTVFVFFAPAFELLCQRKLCRKMDTASRNIKVAQLFKLLYIHESRHL